MARVKGGIISAKRRRNVLRQVKGYRFGRSKKERMAKEAITKAGKYSFAHRRDKKNDYRKLFAVRIGAGLSTSTSLGVNGKTISYSKFIGSLKKQNIALNRKMLAQLAAEYPKAFEAVVAKAK
jgi:large subunit ribosomal protein L20